MRTAVIAITERGRRLGIALLERLSGADLYVQESLKQEDFYKTRYFSGRLGALARKLFGRYDGLIFIMATGIVVRVIAPLIKTKDTDPAVVVVDEAATFSISLLSGHLGGANNLAARVAENIGAIPVITTATDVTGRMSAEAIAARLNCAVENIGMIKVVNSALLHDKKIAVVMPPDMRFLIDGGSKLVVSNYPLRMPHPGISAGIMVTNRIVPDYSGDYLILRPRNLVVGIGCNRNTSADEIEDNVVRVLTRNNLSFRSVSRLASIDIKSDEKGLLLFARKYGFPIDFFSKDELNTVESHTRTSNIVMEVTGARGVCEPSAILSSGSHSLLVHKVKMGNTTIAVVES